MLLDTTITPAAAPEGSSSACSERRLAANRANAQQSTGPRTAEGKAVSSLNAVKTGLTGRTMVFAGEEDAAAYRAHVERVSARWRPEGDRECTLVQSLADTQWRLNRIPSLENGLYALAHLRGTAVLTHENPEIARVLLDAQTEIAEAKALANLQRQESRLRRQYEKDQKELEILQGRRHMHEQRLKREAREEQERQAEAQRREEQARQRAERKKAREAAAVPDPIPSDDGFVLSTLPDGIANQVISRIPVAKESLLS